MDDLLLTTDGVRVLSLKQVLFVLFLVVVFDQAASPIRHLIQTISETLAHLQWLSGKMGSRRGLLSLIRLLPDIVSHKFFHAGELRGLNDIAVDLRQGFHET